MSAEIMTKTEARRRAGQMKKHGWQGARAVKRYDGLYYITTHARGCKCGRCPILHDNGMVQ